MFYANLTLTEHGLQHTEALEITPATFIKDSTGVKIHPAKGCTLTVSNRSGASTSFRLDGPLVKEIAAIIGSCADD